jgi:predicted nucleic-acid-binding protein
VIGIDTNVLVRYVTQDDADQARQANDLIDQLTESRPGYITTIVLAETYWVLRRGYKADKKSVVTVLQGLLDSKEIIVERADTVRRALRRAGDGADFADALITELGVDAGCEHTVTFDQNAARTAGMRLLG